MAGFKQRFFDIEGVEVVALIVLGVTSVNAALVETIDPAAPAYNCPWQITSYAAEAGLTHQRVFDIAFETNGTVWLAASDGLRRYDGYSWQRFDTNSGLPGNFIRSVLVTRAGELWVGSDKGAGVFDPQRKHYDPRGSDKGLASSNVRRIVEDPDGTLWFCCDQWPDTTVKKGGLTSFRHGQWESYGRSRGMPLDYVVGYFRSSSGCQFATTPRGWVQRCEGDWSSPLNPGYEAEESVLHMAEDSAGTLFAQGEHVLLVLTNKGRWEEQGAQTVLVGSTSDGKVIAANWNSPRRTLRFDVWDGGKFVPASSPVSCNPGVRLYRLQQAPDGSIWCVGYGTVLRWAYRAGPWVFYPRLPLPALLDQKGRLWFSGGTNVLVRRNSVFQPLPQLRQLLSVDREGVAWGLDQGKNELVSADPDHPDEVQQAQCGINTVSQVFSDAEDQLWAVGHGHDNAAMLARREGQRWVTVSPPELRNKRITGAWADPRRGLWMVVNPKERLEYELAHLAGGEFQWQTSASGLPPITYASVFACADQYWIYGYSGLYQRSQDPTNGWNRVTAFPDTGFEQFVKGRKEMLVLFGGGPMGKAGCALYHDAKWDVQYGDYDRIAVGQDQQTFFIAARNGVSIRQNPGTLDLSILPFPTDVFVEGLVQDQDKSLWIGTSDGVFHYSPDRIPPQTRIEAALVEVRQNTGLPVTFSAVKRFATDNVAEAFQYSWRFDNGQWSPFQCPPGKLLPLPWLAPGTHRLEVRARDADGNVDPGQAALSFTALDVPLQQRPWFSWLVLLLAALILYLSWIGITRTRQIALSNKALRQEITVRRQTEVELQKAREGLERRVAERTAELSQANNSLSREIEERKQAEQAQRQLEEQLRQSHKMEAVGTLAGGIAHDFNNILAIIIPYCHLAIEDAAGQWDVQGHIRQILDAAERARNLVQQILAFSRQQRQERLVIDLQPTVEEALKMLRSVLPSTIQIVQRIEPVPPTLADAISIHQVIMNLCTNAHHAMNDGSGRLEIEFGAARVDNAFALLHPGLRPGQYIRLCVRDNGGGIAREHLDRIFEPFFTTKEPGQGTGLGLAVVHGIVKNHDGVIFVDSQPGKGTEFQIFLPVVQNGKRPKNLEEAKPAPPGLGEHILLVDDEPAILTAITETLSRAGYKVSSQGDPQAALEDLRAAPGKFDLLFTDLTMPGMTGVELARQVGVICPDLPVLLATGYGGNSVLETGMNANIRKVVEKPLRPSVIIQIVREALDTRKRK